MALQEEAIVSRLERLKQDDCRMIFDGKLRSFRLDNSAPIFAGDRASKLSTEADGEDQVDQMIAILEGLSRRIDGLEQKDRAISDEIRHRARQDQHRRSLFMVSGLAGVTLFVACSLLRWF